MKIAIIIFFILLHYCGYNQGAFAPPAGQFGTTAIHKDSSLIQAWGTGCSVVLGPLDIADPSLGLANFGVADDVNGVANGTIISLGDNGKATVTFDGVIYNGPGFDFAVFENSFSDDFLELAFIEVSSDGVSFFRFPATCNLQDTVQIGPFGSSDATHLNNLAGKYRAQYGTPFDLDELSGISGLNVNEVTHVRIMDCVGSIQPEFASYDQYGNVINDPYPTAFPSGGFDLDAVGLIHFQPLTSISEYDKSVVIYPNPTNGFITVGTSDLLRVDVFDLQGRLVVTSVQNRVDCIDLPPGQYCVKILSRLSTVNQSFMKQ